MKVNKNENRIMIDVDGTLVAWPKDPFVEPKLGYGVAKVDWTEFKWYGRSVWLRPKPYIIGLLTSYKKRGYEITVASANGWQWAEEVVTKLGLRQYVDSVESKFSKYVDDKPADHWMHHVDVNKIDV